MFQRIFKRLLGHDRPVDFALVVALFVVFAILERLSGWAADIDLFRLADRTLLGAAVRSNPFVFGAILALFAAVVWRSPSRLFGQWEALDHGRILRLVALPLLLLMAWQGSLYHYNYLLEQAHLIDRILILGLALAALVRPVFLLPFVLESRIIADQFDYPFGTTAAQNIDALLLLALLALAAAHLLFVITGRPQTAPVILLLGAAVTSHFFIPGRSKLGIDWLETTDISNLPLSSYTAGWRANGDGGWAESMSDLADWIGRPALFATLALELSSVVAAAHYRLLRLWLPAYALFHVVLFALTGFWFLSWIVFEVTLILVLTRPPLRPWLAQNATPARTLFTVAIVAVGASTLFHPPGLAWLDATVSNGYRVEATGVSGTTYDLPLSAFAPLEQELTFLRVSLDDQQPITGAYGALVSAAEYGEVADITSFDEVDARARPVNTASQERGRQLMIRFMNNANRRGADWWWPLAPPDHFWTGSQAQGYDYQEPITHLDVFALTAIHHDGTQDLRRELVLTLEVDEGGKARVVESG